MSGKKRNVKSSVLLIFIKTKDEDYHLMKNHRSTTFKQKNFHYKKGINLMSSKRNSLIN